MPFNIRYFTCRYIILIYIFFHLLKGIIKNNVMKENNNIFIRMTNTTFPWLFFFVSFFYDQINVIRKKRWNWVLNNNSSSSSSDDFDGSNQWTYLLISYTIVLSTSYTLIMAPITFSSKWELIACLSEFYTPRFNMNDNRQCTKL